MACVPVLSKGVVLLLLNHCLLLSVMFVCFLCLILVLLFSALCPFIFAIILMEERERERERESWLLYFNSLPDVL